MRWAFLLFSVAIVVVACSSADETAPPALSLSEADAGTPAPDAGAGEDAAALPDAEVDAGTPAVLFAGRFDATDPAARKTAWPGARIVARFTGSAVSATFSQAAGSDGDGTYVNVVVDDGAPTVLRVTGTSTTLALASGLGAGSHTIEIEKRTEANFGTLTFHGFTFTGGALLPPPARKTRRIEFISDSTMDGYGVDGDRRTTCAGGVAPPQYNDARKSAAYLTAKLLDAEHHLVAASGKGVARNENGSTTELFGDLYPRTLPQVPSSTWAFATFVPDVVVLSVGGSDFATVGGGNVGLPGNFGAKYAALVADMRARYGAGPHVFLTVWSQIKTYNNARQVMTSALDGVANPSAKVHRFSFPESPDVDANETGCQYHANFAHNQAMAALLAAEIKSKTGWQ